MNSEAPPDIGDTAPLTAAITAESTRERIVAECESHAWKNVSLQPWSYECQTLLARIVACDVPGGDLDDLPRIRQRYDDLQAREPSDMQFEDVVDFDLYLPTAAKALYILAVPRSTWFHLRATPMRLLAAIEAWREENIQPQDVPAACLLAQRILSEHRQLMPMHRPRGKGAHSQEGN